MATREELIKQAEAKFNREQLIAQAEAKWAEENAPKPEVPLAQKIETAGRSALEGITLGASEPVIGGINAFISNAIEAGFDAETIGEFAKKAVSGEAIKQEYQKDIARRKALEAALPEVALPAEIAGGVLSGLATGGAATAARGAQAAKVLTAPVKAVEALAGAAAAKVPTAIGQAVARGAVGSGAGEAIKGAIQVPTGAATPEEFDVLGAAKFGGGVSGALGAAAGAIRAAPVVGKRLLQAFGGVSDEAIDAYLKDPGAFIRAKSPEQIKAAMDEFSGKIRESIETGKIDVDQAQRAVIEAREALRDEVSKRSDEFKMAKFDAKALMRDAQAKFDDAKKVLKADTEAALTTGKRALRDETVDAVAALKEKVKQQSAQSYKILESSGRSIQVKPALDAAREALEGLKVQGKPPTTGASAKAYAIIQGYVDDLKRYKNILSASDAKKKIQQLDQDWSAAIDAGEFTSDAQQALRAIRRGFDEQLKDIDAYANVMQGLSRDTDLLGRANLKFGNLERAGAKVARIDLPERDMDRALLVELAGATGRKLDQSLIKIQEAAGKLTPAALEAQVAQLPEASAARAAEVAEARLRMPGGEAPFMRGVEETSPQAMALQKAQQEMAVRQQRLEGVRQTLKEIGPYGQPLSNISAIQTAVNQKNPEYLTILKKLSELSDQDFVKMIDDLRIAQDFQKEFRIGSRNVNLWALGAGAAAYGVTGDIGSSLVIAGMGGGFGSLVDRFGPRMTKRILDGYLKIEGLPTVKKIEHVYSQFPKPIMEQLKNDLVRSVAVASPEDVVIDPSQAAAISRDVTDSSLSSIKKAQMLDAIGRNKPIRSDDLAAVMTGKKAKLPFAVRAIEKETLKQDKPDILKALEERK